jgi:hypothetical protein
LASVWLGVEADTSEKGRVRVRVTAFVIGNSRSEMCDLYRHKRRMSDTGAASEAVRGDKRTRG